MESFNDIYVRCIAKTQVDREAVREWLDHIGADEFSLPAEEQIADPALLVALAAKQCYMSFQPGLNPNVTKVRQDMVEYLDNILKQRHGSVLEHSVFSFAIDGCSRVFTGEMNRHRAGFAVSERSMRFVRYDNVKFWMPECFRDHPDDDAHIRYKKLRSRGILERAFQHDEEMMDEFNDVWADELRTNSTFHAKKTLTSAFRRGIGMGIATGGIWTGNVRALRHVVAVRTDPSAEEEIVHVVGKIGRQMIQALPELFGDFQEVNNALVPEHWKV